MLVKDKKKEVETIPSFYDPLKQITSICKNYDPSFKIDFFLEEGSAFQEASQQLQNAITNFQNKIANQSLISAILLWIQLMANDALFGKRNTQMMMDLIQYQLVSIRNIQSYFLLKDFYEETHQQTIDKIRSNEEWSIPKREDYVRFYLDFSEWLYKISNGYIPHAEDIDRKMSNRRRVPFETYIKLIELFSARERIITKLFYLGGERTLDEILTLNIEDIDFTKETIKFPSYIVKYPSHVFQDIKSYISTRNSGFVFLGKMGERIPHVTPYRVFKTTASKIGLGSSFTFKDLVKEM